jgi:cytohesin
MNPGGRSRPSGILTINDAYDQEITQSPRSNQDQSCPTLIPRTENELKVILTDATTKFNMKPKSARDFLISKGVIHGNASEMADFIYNNNKLSKRRIGEYIGNVEEYNQRVCGELFLKYDFHNKPLHTALRYLLLQFRLPGEAQQIDRILEKFAGVYHLHNPEIYSNSDTVYVLSFSVIMLNTDLHNTSIPSDKKMTLEQFIRNNRGINQGEDLPRDVLEELFSAVKNDEIKMEASDMYESEVVAFMAPTKSGWLLKKTESVLGHWNKHWFVLNDGCMYYFMDPADETPRCIIPLDNTLIGRGTGDIEFVITSATGSYVKSSKVLGGGAMEQGKHTQFTLRYVLPVSVCVCVFPSTRHID